MADSNISVNISVGSDAWFDAMADIQRIADQVAREHDAERAEAATDYADVTIDGETYSYVSLSGFVWQRA